jgi:MFS transporter, DHA2 family, multidrug resistance protein
MVAGLILAAVGFAMLTRFDGHDGLAVVVTSVIVYSLGLAPVFTLATDMMVGSVRPERAGAASAISETGSEFGGALGIAVLGSLGAAIYRTQMATASSVNVPQDAIEAARSTLGAAMTVAGELSGDAGRELAALAGTAFTTGVEFAAISSAGIVIVAAMLVSTVLRNA